MKNESWDRKLISAVIGSCYAVSKSRTSPGHHVPRQGAGGQLNSTQLLLSTTVCPLLRYFLLLPSLSVFFVSLLLLST